MEQNGKTSCPSPNSLDNALFSLIFLSIFAANGLLSVRESKKTEKWIYMQGVNTQSPILSFLFKKQRKQDSTRRE